MSMPFRVTDGVISAQLTTQIATATQRLTQTQEQIASGKRINRPSDDPTGARAVLQLRTSQTVVDQFRRSAGTTKDILQAADSTLDLYQQALDRARTLLAQGASDSTDAAAKQAVA